MACPGSSPVSFSSSRGRRTAGMLHALSLLLALAAPSASAFPLSAELRLQERVSMESLANQLNQALQHGISLQYQPGDIRRLAGPDERDYQRLLASLRSRGFEITEESPTRLWLEISADSAIYERTFDVSIEDLGDGRHRSSGQPRLSGELSLIRSITGLDNTHRLRHTRLLPESTSASLAQSGGRRAIQVIRPQQIGSAYGFDELYKNGLTGQGEEIAIAALSDFPGTPYSTYFAAVNPKIIPRVRRIRVGKIPDVLRMDAREQEKNGVIETVMDIELSGMIAPGATIDVYEGENSLAGILHVFRRILDDNRAKIISHSWGDCEPVWSRASRAFVDDLNALLARADAQGVNVFASSGDDGSSDCEFIRGRSVNFPASSPYAIAVGGTTVKTIHPFLETAWSKSGGGISAIFDSPSWQSGLPVEYQAGRAIPDVAFDASRASPEPAYITVGANSSSYVVNGTSAGVPQWAGFLALVNEGREEHGKKPLGYLNPIIYGMSDADRAEAFNDITTGSNGAFSAGPGWDAVTGWGSMKASGLYSWLLKQ